jgi:hypothetical protein
MAVFFPVPEKSALYILPATFCLQHSSQLNKMERPLLKVKEMRSRSALATNSLEVLQGPVQ